MGWICFRKGDKPVKDIIRDALRPNEVLDIAIVHMRTAYIAFRSKGEVVAGIFLLDYRSDGEFCYKDMDESMGPYQVNCPERILKLLTGEPTGYAKKWREACWLNVNNRKRIKAKEAFYLDNPIQFSDGTRCSEFILHPYKRNRYACTVDGVVCKLNQDTLNKIKFYEEGDGQGEKKA